MNTRRYLIVVLVLLIGPAAASRDIILEEAISMAQSHSNQLKAARAMSDAFKLGLEAAVAERLPTLSASGVASYKDEIPQLEIELPTGDVFRRDFGMKETYQVDLRMTWPIFTGGKISGSVDLARVTRDYYRALESASLDEVLLATRIEYFSLYKADRLIDAARAGLARVRVMAADVESLFEAGAADSVNLLDARLAMTEATSRLTNATSARRKNELQLAILLGLDPMEPIVTATAPPLPAGNAFVYAGVAETKPQLVTAALAVDMSRSTAALNRSDLFPVVSLFGGYSWGKPNLDPFHDEFNDYITLGGNITWSFNLAGKALKNLRKARHQYAAADHEYAATAERLDRMARLAFETLKLTYDNFQTAQDNFRVTSDSYRLASEKHRQGVLSANRLIEIEASLSQAEASLASSQADFYIVQSQYYYATGSNLLKEGK
jgi:outer membrane protein